MKIALDISGMDEMSKKRGIGFYTENLIEALRKYTNADVKLIDENNERYQADIIHFPYFDMFKATLKIKQSIPTVVTIHDVIPLIFPRHYPPGIRGAINLLRQKLTLKKVNAVITDSLCSEKDLERYLNVNSHKIHTTLLAPAESFKLINDNNLLEKFKKKHSLPDSFVLFVGNINWNKNLINLTQACINANVDIYLIGAGFSKTGNLEHVELKSFKEFVNKFSNHSKVHTHGFISNEELVYFYNLATIYLMPSFYEGFGLPILEAQACGTPVITSNISSTVEISGDSALLVDPYNVDEITNAITQILKDRNLRNDLINKGFENSKKYSWEKTALDTYKVYEQVIKN